jgi:hypothetical protein
VCHDGLGHQPREQVLGAVLLGSERRTQSNLETLLGGYELARDKAIEELESESRGLFNIGKGLVR